MIRLLLELIGCLATQRGKPPKGNLSLRSALISVIVTAFRTSVWLGALFKRKSKKARDWS